MKNPEQFSHDSAPQKPENLKGTTPYDSFKGLVEFIKEERQPIDYASIVNPDTRVLALGESHLDRAAKGEVRDSLDQLKEMGFTHLGLEFFGVEMQQILDSYAKIKNESDKTILIKHLKTYSKRDAELYFEIVERAISLGIKVVGLDISQKEKDHYETSQEIELLQKRNPFMAQKIEAVLSENKENKIITFSGRGHIENIDEGDGSMAVNLRNSNIPVATVDLSGRLIERGRPYSYQGLSISECAKGAGVTAEKFMLPAQTKFPNVSIPFDWIMYLPEISV